MAMNKTTSKLIKGILGLGLAAGTFAATTGCDENDVKMLNALSGVIGSGLDQSGSGQQGTSTSPTSPNGSGGNSNSGSGSGVNMGGGWGGYSGGGYNNCGCF